MLHASGSPCKVSSAKAALPELGPESTNEMLRNIFQNTLTGLINVIFLLPAIITDKVSIDTVVDFMGRVKAVPADDALRGWEGAR